MPPDANVLPDTAAVEFLEWLRPGGPWLLVRIHPESQKIVALTANAALAVETFVRAYNGKWNLYYGLNPTLKKMDKKPAKPDIALVGFVLGDLDPNDGETPDAAKARYLAAIEREVLAGTLPSPSAIEDSGNGLQPLWRLKQPIPVTYSTTPRGETKLTGACAEAEAISKAVMEKLGAKAGTQNIDRLLRIPGTTNLPTKSKKEKGRTVGQARMAYMNGATCTLADFARLMPAEPPKGETPPPPGNDKPRGPLDWDEVARHDGWLKSSQDLPDDFTARGRFLIDWGKGTLEELNAAMREAGLLAHDRGYSKWSGVAMALAGILKADGRLSDEKIAAALLCDLPCTRHFRKMKDQRRAIERAIARSHEPDDGHGEIVERFNQRYSVVNDEGRVVVYERRNNAVMRRRYYVPMTFKDLHHLYLNESVLVGFGTNGQPISKSTGQIWLEHPQRRQYPGGAVFDPSGKRCTPDMLNTWQGFAVTPRKGSWRKLRRHIWRGLCRRNKAAFKYLLRWMALLFQHPELPAEVAVVIRGKEGAGKGMLGFVLIALLRDHALHISNAEHLIGKHNDHLRDAVFLFADEAFYAGDKKHAGILKALITEREMAVEPKFAKMRMALNYLHLFMATNEDWAVPAGLDSRRFFMLDASDKFLRDWEHFMEIRAELQAGGYAALLHDLLGMNLSGFNVRDVPLTAELARQREQNLRPHHAWWLDVLMRGYVWASQHGIKWFHQWHETVSTDLLFASYEKYARAHGERHPLSRDRFGRFMGEMKCYPSKLRNAVIGEAIVDCVEGDRHVRKAEMVTKDKRATGYKLGTLDDARAAFTEATGLEMQWPDDAIEEEKTEQPKPRAEPEGLTEEDLRKRTGPDIPW